MNGRTLLYPKGKHDRLLFAQRYEWSRRSHSLLWLFQLLVVGQHHHKEVYL